MKNTEMQNISSILSSFISIDLDGLEKVSLLDRIDTKYTFRKDQLPEFLEKLKQDYFVLEVDHHRMFNYNSLYFDTDSFLLFNLHSSGRMNRYKIRLRNYLESGMSFFEIKFKNNKGRTVKSRVSIYDNAVSDEKSIALLSDKTPFTFEQLKAKMWINYIRITLVSKNFMERLTIDLDLTFKRDDDVKTIDDLVIAELKQSKAGISAFGKLMKSEHIRSGSISKYCFGVVSMFDTIKKNNFKEQIFHINKMLHAAPARY